MFLEKRKEIGPKRFRFLFNSHLLFSVSTALSTKVIVAIIFRNCQNEFRSIIFIDKKWLNRDFGWLNYYNQRLINNTD